MSPLQILHESFGLNAMVVTLIGQMDESNVDTEVQKIYAVIDQIPQGGTLILNFSGLEYMNSKSIGYTMDFYNKMTEKGGKIVIAEAQEQIQDILNVVGLTNVISLFSSLSEAKTQLGFSIDLSPVGAEEFIPPEAIKEEIPSVLKTPIIEAQKAQFSDLVSEIHVNLEKKQSLSEKQEQALENFLNEGVAPSSNEFLDLSIEQEKKSEINQIENIPSRIANNVPNSLASQKSEKEFPVLAISVVVALIIILAVLILK